MRRPLLPRLLLIGVGEHDLAHRGRRLLLLQPVRAPLEAERAAAQCDRTRGDDDHLLAAGGEHGDVGGKAVEPGLAYAPFLVDQQRAADLDDDPPRAQRLGSTAHQAASSRLRAAALLHKGPDGVEHRVHAPMGHGRDRPDLAARGLGQGSAALGDGRLVERVALGEAEQLRLLGQTLTIAFELTADGAVGTRHVLLRAVDQMDDGSTALDMAQEAVAQAGTGVGALDQAGQVGDDEAVMAHHHRAELGLERGEGVVADLGAGAADGG